MNLPGGSPRRPRFAAKPPAFACSSRHRHATCIAANFLDGNSQSPSESVDCRGPVAKTVDSHGSGCCGCHRDARVGLSRRQGGVGGWLTIAWNLGAARYGHRERTCVRVAHGGAERPSGEGNHSTHGHSGRFVVRWENLPPAVFSPDCEDLLRQRHLSRGSGLLAALTASAAVSPPIGIGPHRMSRPGKGAPQATRPLGPVVIRAASRFHAPPERPAAGRGAHDPVPRTRLRLG